MVRAVLSIVAILATVAVLAWCFGVTMPQVTTSLPALNRSVAHTVALMQGGASENGRTPADANTGTGGEPATAGANPVPGVAPEAPAGTSAPTPGAPSPAIIENHRADQPEIISPYSTTHLNPAHVRGIEPSTVAWTAPNPLPAHSHWTWEVGNREFTNVVVTHVDADIVTIASDSGATQIEIALLPGDIRRVLNYDPTYAEQAAIARKTQAP